MPKKKILVVDDERDIVDLVTYNLEREGYETISAYEGYAALELIKKNKPGMVILDLMLPGIDGLEICRYLRKNTLTEKLPVIMLTAKSEAIDRIVGLEIGADDYLTKPFHVRELLARVRAVFRRTEAISRVDDSETFSFRELTVNFSSCEVKVGGKKVEMGATEFKLLKFFTGHPGRVYSRNQLLDHIWEEEAFVEPRTVDVHISRLRAAIEKDKGNPEYILTVRGMGYKFAEG
jgi:two-component system alkaline phosphatase synthesis response regulator PhoP